MADECRSLKDVLGRMTEAFVMRQSAVFMNEPERFSEELVVKICLACPSLKTFVQMIMIFLGVRAGLGCHIVLGYIFYMADEDEECAKWLDERLPFMHERFMETVMQVFLADPSKFIEAGGMLATESVLLARIMVAIDGVFGAEAERGAWATLGLFLYLEETPSSGGEPGELPQ
ncbi:hypothetical protein A3D60_03210 [Candidatus Uhrbacteria bacterium RIFCSPHIGHO2_02_FULL_47_29]|uniref:Uncharacterized protein n=1 Tax=Candidatus Uhrbacteria bacterium RIFCSPLOWO2_01_FULL_47_25 TaxID=1802402 RepID=A0A1F7UX65_9BACT|nr:MAG: hypothetical protein A3D60_03210 [Candidatus Uhrbacteria bacterium RIFCSPHIGHO2_02_FULL_47_29]OGL82859.1 MAG: hypothetical protein A2936_04310 [Candidatus Uhrbacteria bacterium RIFCSPLOWO2_01_FULL_47_25]OGL85886.1 MAG: hypothetical protein A3I37_00840 [Candidatus Uhrbacteria bacterium RIFCSPLOWO2_02_FULL_46_19]